MLKRQAINVVMLEVSGWGGLCHYTFNFCQELSRAGANVVLLSNKDYELINQHRDFHLIRVLETSQYFLKKWQLILKYLLKNRTDIFHIQTLITARKDFAIFFLMKFFRFKIIYTAHNVLPHDENEKNATGMNFSFRCIYHLANFIITHSEKDKEEIITTFNVSPNKMKAIPHGDYDFLRTTGTGNKGCIREKYHIGKEEKVILFFGALRRYKGVYNLISAFASVKGNKKSMKLLIVGHKMGDNYFNELQDIISKHNLHDSVILDEIYVPFEEIGYYFEAADVVALPYEHIYDSGVLRLAFSFEKPVIATRVGIFNELVIDGKNGFLVNNDLDGLMKALKRFQSTKVEDLKAMGEYSKKSFGKGLKWENIAAETLKIYKSLLWDKNRKVFNAKK